MIMIISSIVSILKESATDDSVKLLCDISNVIIQLLGSLILKKDTKPRLTTTGSKQVNSWERISIFEAEITKESAILLAVLSPVITVTSLLSSIVPYICIVSLVYIGICLVSVIRDAFYNFPFILEPKSDKKDTFEKFGLRFDVLHGLVKFSKKPTAYANHLIPAVLSRRHVISTFTTGQIKTASVVGSFMNFLDEHLHSIQCIYIVPNSEIGSYVLQVMDNVCEFVDVEVLGLCRNTPNSEDIRTILNVAPSILVVTMEKFLELNGHRGINMSKVTTIVIDYCDHSINSTTVKKLNNAMEKLNSSTQIILLAQKLSETVKQFMGIWMPERLYIGKQRRI
ncbi:hypothetical protein CAEBREN_29694 [Caenorhabditis brenneri]|uniref:ATP-dependent RNA helicase n=1 Tax=Caenorhabditis brenneri TaxID=135651 RepID=G0P1T2_CAEBE|nr:hypothetical protein CAEBREN_29694 [Caenorhabditis brenneri]